MAVQDNAWQKIYAAGNSEERRMVGLYLLVTTNGCSNVTLRVEVCRSPSSVDDGLGALLCDEMLGNACLMALFGLKRPTMGTINKFHPLIGPLSLT